MAQIGVEGEHPGPLGSRGQRGVGHRHRFPGSVGRRDDQGYQAVGGAGVGTEYLAVVCS